MGFLTAAYGKLMAARHLREIQYQQADIQRRLRQVTREIGQKDKMYQAQERNMRQSMQSQMQQCIMGAAYQAGLPIGNAMMGMNGMGAFGQDCSMFAAMGGFNQQQMQLYSAVQQQAQMQFMQAQTLWQNMFEMQRDADLQALKDLEADLQTENESLNSQIKIAEEEYNMYKEQEKSGAKAFTPESGQG